MPKPLKITLSVIAAVIVVVAIAALMYFFLPGSMPKESATPTTDTEYTAEKGTADCIHFLNTGSSDCIIIESQGHIAIVDAAEDTDFPADKPDLEYKGYENEIVDYLLKNFADEDGNVTVDFIVGTHAHSDHLGGFDTIIDNEHITVLKAYLKEYNADKVRNVEVEKWDNQEVYDQTITALKNDGAEIVQDIDSTPFNFYNFTITLYNGEYDTSKIKKGENQNSLGVLVEKAGKRAFLAGDMNWLNDNDEKRIAKLVGKVDLLKVGHHGYPGSTSHYWVKTLDPSIAIITNSEQNVYTNVKRVLTNNGTYMYPTVENGGIRAYFTDDGQIILNKDYSMNG